MAENKNSFVLYSDLIHTVNKLPDDKAGQLLKHILSYVNDENPETEDLIIQIAFEPIKQHLKRDLKSWEKEKQDKSGAGVIGNLKRWHPDLYKLYQSDKKPLKELLSIASNRKASHSDKSIAEIAVTVNDNVIVNDNVNEIKKSKAKLKISSLPLAKRKTDFKSLVFDTVANKRKKYQHSHELDKFFAYWSEHGINDRKMRFEKEKSFGIERRLDIWFKNAVKFNKESFSGAYKTYTHQDIVQMMNKNFPDAFEFYRPIKVNDSDIPIFVSKDDIVKYNLKPFKK